MEDYARILKATEQFLRKMRITPVIRRGKPTSQASIDEFQKLACVQLPQDFCLFYTEFANGYEFTWQGEEMSGGFQIGKLDELIEARGRWTRFVNDFLDNPRSLNKCVHRKFRSRAFDVWREMQSWLPLIDEPNGDGFCLDLRNGQIILNQHDWFDGFGLLAKTNGISAGRNLKDFLQNWSRFCFCGNNSGWWGEFEKFGKINWSKEYFDPEFIRPE